MASSGKKCCVENCSSTGQTHHRFPNPKFDLERMKLWLDVIGSEELNSQNPVAIHRNKRICFAHFEVRHKSAGNSRLHRNAVPTIGVPGFQEVPDNQPWDSEPIAVEQPIAGPSNNAPLPEALRSATPPATPNDVRRILRSVNVSRKHHLSPKSRKLYRTAVHLKRVAYSANRKLVSFKDRVAAAEEFSKTEQFNRMLLMTPAAQTFLNMQMRETTKKPRGRRFTTAEKVLTLTLLKQSPKAYTLLQKLFTMPSRSTMNIFLGRMCLRAGINKILFLALKKKVQKLAANDRMCTVMFDEISLTAHLQLNVKLDVIEGFVDTGLQRVAEFADHALVFMVRGLVKQWKQPVYFSFCKGMTHADSLQSQLALVVRELQQVGLKVISTVCDQASANVKAIHGLQANTEGDYARKGEDCGKGFFEINKQRIVALFDPPHLIKGIRNNMLQKDLECVIDGVSRIAKWQHISDLYALDRNEEVSDLRMLPKLAEHHIRPNHTQKMKVKFCTQVFSQRVAAIMRYISRQNPCPLGDGAEDTAMVLLFLDKLFDSVNGSQLFCPEGKPLRGAVKEGSAHHEFWPEAIQVLATMKFIDRTNPQLRTQPPSVKNFRTTLQGFQLIWKTMKKCAGIKYVFPRNFNQDPLENYFGMIRSQGARNINPSCTTFISSFKTLTINNFMSTHSIGSNCEDDYTEGALSSMRSLLTDDVDDEDETIIETYKPADIPNVNEEGIALNNSNYCAGFVLRHIKKCIGKCVDCKSDLEAVKAGIQHGIISAREYDSTERLVYPSISSVTTFIGMKKITFSVLKKNCEKQGIRKYIISEVKDKLDFSFVTCDAHKNIVVQTLIEKTISLIVFHWISEINKILSGRTQISSPLRDPIKIKANERHEKYVKYKKHNKI